jgi:recombination protein RecA
MGQALNDLKEALEPQAEVKMPVKPKDPLTVLKAVEAQLNAQFKTVNSIVRMGDRVGVPVPSISTGLYTLDLDVLQCGGIPRGKFIELFGPESSGKTSLALHIVGREQKAGGTAAYIDVEHALDPSWASLLGVDMDNLWVAQPDSGEQALETAEALVDSGVITLIVIDSVAALVPQSELDGEMGDANMGAQARLMGQACRKLRGKCSTRGVAIIWINQLREKLGVMFGSPEVTPGGKALKFQASVRLDVRRRTIFREGGKDSPPIGHEMAIKAVKNKVGKFGRETIVTLWYDRGLDVEADLITYAKNIEVIKQSGAWFSYNTRQLGQGMPKTIEMLKADRSLYLDIYEAVQALQAVKQTKEN